MGRQVPTGSSTLVCMPHTLSDAETSLLLHHILRNPAEPSLIPIIHSLHSSLVTSRTASPYSTTNSGDVFLDFLGSGEFPEDSNYWDTPSLPNPSLPNLNLSNPNPNLPLQNPSLSDLLDDRRNSVNSANFDFNRAICDYTLACCDYADLAATSCSNDYGISPSLIFNDCEQGDEDGRVDRGLGGNGGEEGMEDTGRMEEGMAGKGQDGNGGEDQRRNSERSVARNSEDISEERGRRKGRGGRGKKPKRCDREKCKRGGSSWVASGAIEDSQRLSKPCMLVLASLSSQGNLLVPTMLDSPLHALIVEMRNMLSGESWKESQTAFQVNSLENIILRCQRAEKLEVTVQFISMINFIQLAAKVERYIYSFKSLSVSLNLLALAFAVCEISAVEQKSYVRNSPSRKEKRFKFTPEPCRSGWLLEQN